MERQQMQIHEMTTLPVGHLIDPEELLDPIGFLRTEHDEQRTFCHRLDGLVGDLNQEESAAEASSLLDFLFGEMALNMVEEEKLLAPLLHERCVPEDMLDAALDETWKTHLLIALLFPDIGGGLGCLSAGQTLERPLDFIFQSLEFIDVLQQHVDREDLILLPLAEFCLTTEDYVWLGYGLARHHGLPYPTVPGMMGQPFSSAETRSATLIDSHCTRICESRRRTAWRQKKAAISDELH
jgi:hemerythrin-like domain-containing protein